MKSATGWGMFVTGWFCALETGLGFVFVILGLVIWACGKDE